MNLAQCSALSRRPRTGSWYRAIPPQYWQASLNTAHTRNFQSRFSPGPLGNPPFEILYFCENATVALYEVQAQFRSSAGSIIPNPRQSWLIINVDVVLQEVADLSDPAEQQLIDTTAQEITGDWEA